jgi:hypothetical protein
MKVDINAIIPSGWRLVDCKTEQWQLGDCWFSSSDMIWKDDMGSCWGRVPVIRRIAVKPKVGWRVYDVKALGGVYYVIGKCKHDGIRLSNCIDMVGFGGVQFEGQIGNAWVMGVCALIDGNGSVCGYCESDDKPAVPIRARFWEAQ